jgi:serine acetyltransferase
MLSRLRSDIQCILDRDPAARSTWEVITCYPGLHAIWLQRLRTGAGRMGSSGWGASSRTWDAGSPALKSTPVPSLASACSSITAWAW